MDGGELNSKSEFRGGEGGPSGRLYYAYHREREREREGWSERDARRPSSNYPLQMSGPRPIISASPTSLIALRAQTHQNGLSIVSWYGRGGEKEAEKRAKLLLNRPIITTIRGRLPTVWE